MSSSRPSTIAPARKFRLYAHRGACLKAPENTLDAFRQALHDGANALELDIHLTRDGHFVVMHDAEGTRTAGRRQQIRDLDLADVKRWRLEHVEGGGCAVPATVPTLEEVLTELPGVPMSVDLKPARPRYAAELVDLLTRHGADDRVTVASFHDRVIHRVRRLGYPGRTTLTRLEVVLLRFSPLLLPCRIIRGQAAQVPLSAGPIRLDHAAFLTRCRTLGLRADYWVVNSLEQARQLVARGATGVMSDDPARIAPLLNME